MQREAVAARARAAEATAQIETEALAAAERYIGEFLASATAAGMPGALDVWAEASSWRDRNLRRAPAFRGYELGVETKFPDSAYGSRYDLRTIICGDGTVVTATKRTQDTRQKGELHGRVRTGGPIDPLWVAERLVPHASKNRIVVSAPVPPKRVHRIPRR